MIEISFLGGSDLFRYIDENLIGKNHAMNGPWGPRMRMICLVCTMCLFIRRCISVIYADYTASGRCLSPIEDYMNRFVMPTYVDYSFLEEILFDFLVISRYSNTHSENNACAEQTTRFREGARALIKRAVNATDEDVLIFTGTGKISREDLSRYENSGVRIFRSNRSNSQTYQCSQIE